MLWYLFAFVLGFVGGSVVVYNYAAKLKAELKGMKEARELLNKPGDFLKKTKF